MPKKKSVTENSRQPFKKASQKLPRKTSEHVGASVGETFAAVHPKRPVPTKPADWFREGTRFVGRGEWEWAIEAFRQAVRGDRHNLLYRQKLRATECHRFKNNGVGVGKRSSQFVRLAVQFSEAERQEAWHRMDDIIEEGLVMNPWHVEFNLALIRSFLARRWPEMARFSIESLKQIKHNCTDLPPLEKKLIALEGAIKKETPAKP